MRMLVLGGTVFLSTAVAVEDRDRGHEVTAAARGASGSPLENVRFVRIDRTSAAGTARAWYEARTEQPRFDAGLSRRKEAAVLAARHTET